MAANTLDHIPFLKHLGVRVEEAGHAGAVLVLDTRPEHMNSLAMAHGGVLMTLLDVCMAQAGRARARHEGAEDHGVITIEMKSTFMLPAAGERLYAWGNCLHRTANMCFCEGEVRDDKGRVLSRGSGTFKYVKPRFAQARRAATKSD